MSFPEPGTLYKLTEEAIDEDFLFPCGRVVKPDEVLMFLSATEWTENHITTAEVTWLLGESKLNTYYDPTYQSFHSHTRSLRRVDNV